MGNFELLAWVSPLHQKSHECWLVLYFWLTIWGCLGRCLIKWHRRCRTQHRIDPSTPNSYSWTMLLQGSPSLNHANCSNPSSILLNGGWYLMQHTSGVCRDLQFYIFKDSAHAIVLKFQVFQRCGCSQSAPPMAISCSRVEKCTGRCQPINQPSIQNNVQYNHLIHCK